MESDKAKKANEIFHHAEDKKDVQLGEIFDDRKKSLKSAKPRLRNTDTAAGNQIWNDVTFSQQG